MLKIRPACEGYFGGLYWNDLWIFSGLHLCVSIKKHHLVFHSLTHLAAVLEKMVRMNEQEDWTTLFPRDMPSIHAIHQGRGARVEQSEDTCTSASCVAPVQIGALLSTRNLSWAKKKKGRNTKCDTAVLSSCIFTALPNHDQHTHPCSLSSCCLNEHTQT